MTSTNLATTGSPWATPLTKNSTVPSAVAGKVTRWLARYVDNGGRDNVTVIVVELADYPAAEVDEDTTPRGTP